MKERWLEDAKPWVEKKLEGVLRRDVDIGSVEGGIFDRVILRNITFGASSYAVIHVDEAVLHCSLWNIINKSDYLKITLRHGTVFFEDLTPLITELNGQIVLEGENVYCHDVQAMLGNFPLVINGVLSDFSAAPSIDVNITTPLLNGSFVLKDTLANPSLEGTFDLFGKTTLKLFGNVSPDGLKIVQLYLEKEPFGKNQIEIQGTISPQLDFSFWVKLNHLIVGEFDLVSGITIEGRAVRTSDQKVDLIFGQLKTFQSVINYKPFEEIEATYLVTNQMVRILTAKVSENFLLFGTIGLVSPYEADLVIGIEGMELAKLAMFTELEKEDVISGSIDGELKIYGPIARPHIRGWLEASNGNIGTLKYKLAKLNLKGEGAHIEIADSWIFREEGTFLLEGPINLTLPLRGNLTKGLVIKSDQTMVWEGWDIKGGGSDRPQLSLKKDIGDDFLISFETNGFDEFLGEEKSENELGLEYKLWGDKSLKMELKEDEEFLALEHKLKF